MFLIALSAFTLSGCDMVKDFLGLSEDEPEVKEEPSFTVTFDANEGSWADEEKGSLVNSLPVSTEKGGRIILPEAHPITAALAFFGGWNTGQFGEGDPVTEETVVTENTTVYAQWVAPADWEENTLGGLSKDFGYLSTGDHIQTFTVPKAGEYKFELWGAQGGTGSGGSRSAGGYSSGSITLDENTQLFLYVGGGGGNAGAWNNATRGGGGWNGGGYGGQGSGGKGGGGGGGGGTDVRLEKDALNTRIIVAGGGGGGCHGAAGGSGGGVAGTNGKYGNYPSTQGGTQTTGYSLGVGQSSVASVAGSGTSEGRGGGGGGYWGGHAAVNTTGTVNAPGAGGSGFVYGYSGTSGVGSGEDWIPSAYEGYQFIDGVCLAGNDSPHGNPGGSNGYIRITFKPAAQ